jgi:hypothetical protein
MFNPGYTMMHNVHPCASMYIHVHPNKNHPNKQHPVTKSNGCQSQNPTSAGTRMEAARVIALDS